MDCTGCPQLPPPLTYGLEVFVKLYLNLAPALVDGWGGINLAAWESGLRLYQVPQAWWPELTRKLVRLLSILNENRKPETGNGFFNG